MLLMIPAMILGQKIYARFQQFGFWFCRYVLPRADDTEPVGKPQNSLEAREILKTPREDFFRYISRSFLFAFFFEVLAAFVLWLLFSMFLVSMEVDFRERGYDLKLLVLYALPMTAIQGFCLFMAYRSEMKKIRPWLTDYDYTLKHATETQVFRLAEEYCEYMNTDRDLQKRIRRRFLIGGLAVIVLIGGLIGWSGYHNNKVARSLGTAKYQFKGFQYTIQPEGTAHICNYYGTAPAELIVPETLNGAHITAIDSYAFVNQKRLESIVLPEGVTVIGYGAFYGCESLTAVDLPESVKKIGRYAFSGCGKLSSIRIPQGVMEIGSGAFSRCSSLTSLTVPEGISSIQDSTFSDCEHLESVILPDSIFLIGKSAFEGCSALTVIDIPGNVREIGEHAFKNCTCLYAVTIPDGVETIGAEAFCSTGLKKVLVPASVRSLGDRSFASCQHLKSAVILNDSIELEGNPFAGCESLKDVSLPSDANPLLIRDEMQFSEDGKTLVSCWRHDPELVIPEGVEVIGSSAFEDNQDLVSVVFPDSLKKIEARAFKDCCQLNAITFSTGLREIGENAFEGCYALKELSLPDGLLTIGDQCFAFCFHLQKIDLPDGLQEIGTDAFWHCTDLEQVTIPESVLFLHICSFKSCPALTLTIPPAVKELDQGGSTDEDSFKTICFRVVRGSETDLWLQEWLNDLNRMGWGNKVTIKYYDPA